MAEDNRAHQVELDEIDKSIIRVLQVDGRMPYSKLGPEVGLSRAAVRQRVQRLLDHGVIEVVAVSEPFKMGFNVQAMIGINADGDLRVVAAALSDVDQVVYVVLSSGRYDILIEVIGRDSAELLTILNDVVRRIPGVRSTELFTYMKIEKVTYSWGAL
ncbi:Lrp/AsnC family transcriptional regulator [Nonomuraea typhae]|uniref:Lrp/AsnC family transcriptional regulator n=1 Tax=Nonomuraea typhae TaxID=2603600 RepID=A0ABW7YU38_9ACTN